MAASAFPFWALLCIIVGVGMIVWFKRRAANASQNDKPDQFAQDAMDVMSAAYPDYVYRYNAEEDLVIGHDADGEEQHRMSLTNLRHRVAELGRADRIAYLKSFAEQIGADLLTPEDASRLRLRPRTEEERQLRAQQTHLTGKTEAAAGLDALDLNPPSTELFGPNIGDILLQPMVDGETTLRSLGAGDLSRLGMTMEQVMERARRNMFEDLPPAERLWERLSEHVFIMTTQDDLEVARLVALGDMIPTPQRPLDQLVCFFPAHAICLVATDRSEAVLAEMVRLGMEMSETQRPFSSALWELSDEGWTIFGQRDPHNSVAMLARTRSEVAHHGEQTHVLTQAVDAAELDIHVANLMAFQNGSGEILTTAVYIGAGSLIPVVQEVRWHSSTDEADASIIVVPWAAFSHIMGLDGVPSYQGLRPTRHYFEHDPTPEQATALRRVGRLEADT